MRSIRVIPCLDVKDGRVVKGVQFVGLRDAGDPVQLARHYYEQGADELVFLDITASSDDRAPIIDLARRVAEEVFIPFTVGGGLRDVSQIREALLAGADKVSLNSACLARPALIQESSEMFGSQCIVVAIDARKRATGDGWEVLSHGGRNQTGRDAVEWAVEAWKLGAGEFLVTSMDGDGSLAGYDLALTRAIADAVRVPVIASGGAGNPDHLAQAVEQGHADATLIASIVHDGTYTIADLKNHLHEKNIPVRRWNIPRRGEVV